MLLIVIVALIATTAFYRQAKVVRVHPGKAASIPFIAAGLFLIVGGVASFGIETFAAWANAAPATIRVMYIMANVFLLIAYLLLIRRNWLTLTTTSRMDSPP